MDSCDILLECGFTKPLATLKMKDVNQWVKCASLHSTLMRIKSELDQFISGLDAACVLHAIREYPDFFAPIFIYQGKALTAGKRTGRSCIYTYYNNYYFHSLFMQMVYWTFSKTRCFLTEEALNFSVSRQHMFSSVICYMKQKVFVNLCLDM